VFDKRNWARRWYKSSAHWLTCSGRLAERSCTQDGRPNLKPAVTARIIGQIIVRMRVRLTAAFLSIPANAAQAKAQIEDAENQLRQAAPGVSGRGEKGRSAPRQWPVPRPAGAAVGDQTETSAPFRPRSGGIEMRLAVVICVVL
jgi:hypothetical protein